MIQDLNNYFTDIYFNLHPVQEENISHQSIRILQMVQKKKNMMIRDIANELMISHNTASEHVKKLVRNGWLYKERSENDQRKVFLHLTDIGSSIVKKHTELDDNKLRIVLSKLTATERAKVIEGFKLLSEVSK
ncbi:MarR family winged helix-turn-helix transcriptional regulator [Heyndrickxia oleronia]|jgi:DNA-binding MarR family transcriptional regulator|uniref:HTH-type transcriptional regulator MgrA n=1 Tax=Heyndrickxia oleronia TaxID=38875 RepID=A0A8E2IAX6_9BACI|nr:MarR family transcriptional regulator [Heyndrickxia oleronia]NYV67849.1 MarR family transcriptional regulator [Bacillus sp. Gen3]MBU5210717.1 MarR family transcriptional regulator [Heyndrickxia oleronia]MCI1592590.1 MarR family transcriptional regulator [Heyndrickxia oleronia]MCI1614808.1 MarR family transcriptional regulator [Heyndrickxia oleronia]MCI1762694.1 MarR family transcriptional regulator [Heyndrickxia oleronia]